MVAILSALLFSAAFAGSIWAMFVTIAPRIGYMRALLQSGTVARLIPPAAPRIRNVTRPAVVSTMLRRPVRAAA